MDHTIIILLAISSSICSCVRAFKNYQSADQDKIVSLPGIPKTLNFMMYSGYLDISEEKKMHYWLNTCTAESCDRLVVWLNGGPGCSSLDGLFHENGPFKFNPKNGNLVNNVYSWNKLAHTLYIEAPVGVGFSYDLLNEPVSDDSVAQDLLKAIFSFFEKFPHFSSYDVYFSGESYAGVYIPMLVTAIVESETALADRVKGISIGNGFFSRKLNDQSLVYFAYYHGLLGTALWHSLLRLCCNDERPDQCQFYKFRNTDCMLQYTKVVQIVSNSGLNVYNLYQDCTSPIQDRLTRYFDEDFQKEIRHNSKLSKRLSRSGFYHSNLGLIPPCANVTFLTRYLNRVEVQEAIHVAATNWELCSDQVNSNYRKQHRDMTPFIKRIIEETDARVLLYFGDVDMACNYMGGEWFMDQLGYQLISPRRTWFITEDNGSEQIAGFVKEANKLVFATVKGAGHMVPTDKPRAAYFMMQRFLDDEPL